MSYENTSQRPPGNDESDSPHALQRSEHQHTDVLQQKLQRVEHEHADVLQEKLQQREHEHQDILQERLQRREHEHEHSLLDRRPPDIDPFSAHLALLAVASAVVLNGVALLLLLGHAAPAKMAPFAAGLVAGFIPTMMAWTVAHQARSSGARAARYGARLVWVLSIVLFAIGSVFAAA